MMYTSRVLQALRHLHGGKNERGGAGANLRAVKAHGVQVFEDDGIMVHGYSH